ncbi:MAG: DUF3604 domain-containing protein [Anaerolineae bacterium]|nr:DUF3604 domain-containing protein [Anaerolineae bacterium]
MSLHLYWGDSHLNLHHRDRQDFELAFQAAREHLDFLPIAYYPMEFYQMDCGLRVESWHNRPEFLQDWEEINALCAKHYKPGEFVTFPGYEWHGNRTRWGDHNVYYFAEGNPLDDTDDIEDLYAALRKRKGLAIPHHIAYMVGQRGKDWDHFDPQLSPFAEIYSAHGCSETPVNSFAHTNHPMGPWTSGGALEDALARGLKVGLICSGDNHNRFAGAYGRGIMAVWAEALTREALWEAFLARRVYGTTGDRMVVRYQINDAWMGSEISSHGPVRARIQVECPQALDRIEWIRNNRVLQTYCHQEHLPEEDAEPLIRLRFRIELGWGPQPLYGFHDIIKEWQGQVTISEGELSIVQGCWTDFGNSLEQVNEKTVGFSLRTSAGNVPRGWRAITAMLQPTPMQAFILEARAPRSARLSIEAAPFDVSLTVKELLSRTSLWADLEGSKALIQKRFGVSPKEVENPDIYYHNAYKLRVTQGVPEKAFWAEIELTDPHPPKGENWYYVRVSQRDGHTAWISPIWVEQH